ncbi:hypothetical protein [Arthrobacter sp. RAF14]|uniref:hypothetical protein n=1 Tax=Arthrobacter sp. RAF14 TaxID=3233051 RepID=UPI003F90075D
MVRVDRRKIEHQRWRREIGAIFVCLGFGRIVVHWAHVRRFPGRSGRFPRCRCSWHNGAAKCRLRGEDTAERFSQRRGNSPFFIDLEALEVRFVHQALDLFRSELVVQERVGDLINRGAKDLAAKGDLL